MLNNSPTLTSAINRLDSAVTDKRHRQPAAERQTEAFLYRRLETLPETAGQFRLNAELPIPFDGWGQMEVDLLCAEARVAVELDGSLAFG